jgi:UDP-N-acetylmuramoyl-tripeptide--D-alanyl-D-alanine ligase
VNRTLAQFAQDCGGRLAGEDRAYAGVSTDTRTIARGELFVALRGPRFDGREFVAAARAAGAAGVVVDEPADAAIPQIVAGDTLAALTRAARAWRERCAIPVVGVAGSNGKTTTKEMIAAILGEAGPTLATRGNLNNHIGVPLTLLRIEPSHRYAVIEMGANRAGEVAHLARIARPTIGIVTNAGAEHLEGFGDLEGVARAEGELFAALDPDAVAVLNADDEFAPLWRRMTRARVVEFAAVAPPAPGVPRFGADGVRTSVDAGGFLTRFAMIAPPGRAEISLRLAGMHNVLNALGAAAAACAAGATLQQVAAGLASMRPVRGRLQFRAAAGGAWIIDDSYNANPSSMRAGIDVLCSLEGRRWLAIGDMAELGAHARASHVEVGRYARERGVERLFATGELAALAAESFGQGAHWFPGIESMSQGIAAELDGSVRLLVKGSRMNRLERVVEALAAPQAG